MKTKRRIVLLAVAALLAVISVGLIIAMNGKINSLAHENVSKGFSDDREYVQITVFLPESAEFTYDKLMYFRYNIEKALTDNSLEAQTGARLYIDTGSAFKDISLDSESSKYTKAKAVYIFGDYSFFHKEFSFAPDITQDINHDRVLVSKLAAWNLYGGYELYDFKVTDGSRDFYISGVYDDYRGAEYDAFYGDSASCVIDMTGYPDMGITCYEIMIVNPVKNFAKEAVVKALELEDGTYELVVNSERFSFANLFNGISRLLTTDKPLPEGVNLTPEELVARQAEKELSFMLAIVMLLSVYPTVYVCVWAIRLIMLLKKLANKHIIQKIKEKFSYS